MIKYERQSKQSKEMCNKEHNSKVAKIVSFDNQTSNYTRMRMQTISEDSKKGEG